MFPAFSRIITRVCSRSLSVERKLIVLMETAISSMTRVTDTMAMRMNFRRSL